MQETYTRPVEEQRIALEEQLAKLYPQLEFGIFNWIDESNVHLVIDDLTFRAPNKITEETLKMLQFSCQGKLRICPLAPMTKNLMSQITVLLSKCNPQTTLVIFPGEGAASVKDALPSKTLSNFHSIFVEAKRVKNKQTGIVDRVTLPNIIREMAQATEGRKITTILVLDDVIDTGKTLRTLKQESGLGKANWFAGAPIMFSPLPYELRSASKSSVEGYERIFTSLLLQGIVNPIPLNSLSSFIEGGGKTQRLVSKCLNQYVRTEEQTTFVNTLLQLRNMFG